MQEDVQGTGIAGFDQDAHPWGFLPSLQGTLELVQVYGQVMSASLVPDQAVHVLGFVDEGWPHPSPGPLFVADEAFDLALLQQLSRFGSDLSYQFASLPTASGIFSITANVFAGNHC
jgi:hypothetical protein